MIRLLLLSSLPAILIGTATAQEVKRSEELREVVYQYRETLGELKRLQGRVEWTEERLARLSRLVDAQEQLDVLRHKLEESTDEAREKLEEQVERLAAQIEHQHVLLAISEELREFEELRREAREEELNEFVEPVEAIVKQLEEKQSITEELIKIHVDGPEEELEPLLRRNEELEEAIDLNRERIDLTHELFAAYEEEDDERIEWLEARLEKLSPKDKSESKEEDEDDSSALNDPLRQPIPVTPEAVASVAELDFSDATVPLLRKYCFECHNNDSQSGELNIERMIGESPIVLNREKWINVLEQTKNRVMPPEDEQQPSEDDRTRLVLTLHHAIHNFDYSNIVDPGYERVRRLTHDEYDNTVRDLFGADLRVAKRFPSDMTGKSGFDNSANTLFIQPILMERYIGAAEFVVTSALPDRPDSERLRAARARIFIQEPSNSVDERAAAETVLSRFLLRAYRRPASDEQLARALKQYESGRARGLEFDDAVKSVIQTTLISPGFLFKSETKGESESAYKIDDWDLASRLSYFLWASMPDDELFDLAASGRLNDEPTLLAQIKRMIEDPKSKTLGSIFAAQWLGSQHLGTRMRLDPIDNPWCTDSLMASMRDETAMFFHSLVLDNQPIQRLIDADFTYLNEELAKLYRIPGVKGDEMRRVSLKTDQRGGIFGQGSLLAVTSFPYRTSPVVRGKWILADVLGTPPPPPPPNVSELPEEIEENDRLTFRQKLELHRRAPNCYACHSQMDPLGFSLENYDWFGRWRGSRRRRKSDVRGTLPNGTQFEGLAGLKRVVVEQRSDDLLRQVSSKMLSYALGRQLEYYDEPALRKIVANVKADDYRLRTLIREIVTSYPFQYKKNRVELARVGATHPPDQ